MNRQFKHAAATVLAGLMLIAVMPFTGDTAEAAGKKIVVIGDRDGVPGEAISACVETAGGEVVFSSTECFV